MESKKKKRLTGEVTSNKMEKTVKVTVTTPTKHKVYKKIVKVRKNFMARTSMDLEIGDVVTIEESRPYSKNVRWVVIEKK